MLEAMRGSSGMDQLATFSVHKAEGVEAEGPVVYFDACGPRCRGRAFENGWF